MLFKFGLEWLNGFTFGLVWLIGFKFGLDWLIGFKFGIVWLNNSSLVWLGRWDLDLVLLV